MENAFSYTSGNLALKINEQPKRSARPRFSVVEGNRAYVVCLTGHHCQTRAVSSRVNAAEETAVTPTRAALPASSARKCANAHAVTSLSAKGLIPALAIVFVCLAVVISVFSVHAHAVGSITSNVETASYEVLSGEGLWDVAAKFPLDGLSTREEVDYLKELNGLSNATLQPGQELVVPKTCVNC